MYLITDCTDFLDFKKLTSIDEGLKKKLIDLKNLSIKSF